MCAWRRSGKCEGLDPPFPGGAWPGGPACSSWIHGVPGPLSGENPPWEGAIRVLWMLLPQDTWAGIGIFPPQNRSAVDSVETWTSPPPFGTELVFTSLRSISSSSTDGICSSRRFPSRGLSPAWGWESRSTSPGCHSKLHSRGTDTPGTPGRQSRGVQHCWKPPEVSVGQGLSALRTLILCASRFPQKGSFQHKE